MHSEKSVPVQAPESEELFDTHVLIMEDDVDYAYWLKEVLEDAGYVVDWVMNGSEALGRLETKSYDLLISDIYVYENGKVTTDGGITLIGRTRLRSFQSRSRPDRKMPVIAISGAVKMPGNQFILKTAEDLGAAYSLRKPVGADALLHTVSEALTS